MSLTNRNKSEGQTEFELIPGGRPASAAITGKQRADAEIDLLELAWVLLDKIHYIILYFLAGAVLFNVYSYVMIKPTYQSTAKMYVVSASNDSVVDLTDLNIGTSLTSDYEQLMLSYPVLEQVIDMLDLPMDSDSLARMISLVNPQDTRILNITVTSTDPEQARDIANTLLDVSVEYLPKTMDTNAPNVAQRAKLADEKAGPSYTRYTMMGAVLGAFLYCAYLLFRYLIDDTIRTPEDMEKYFGVVPLTVVPDSEIFAEGKENIKKKSLFGKGRRRS